MKLVLESGSSSVLLNGVPGTLFNCHRGFHQGDPLSPLLFALTTDLLQSIINFVCVEGLLSLPIDQPANEDFPVIQYFDDMIIILPTIASQLHNLHGHKEIWESAVWEPCQEMVRLFLGTPTFHDAVATLPTDLEVDDAMAGLSLGVSVIPAVVGDVGNDGRVVLTLPHCTSMRMKRSTTVLLPMLYSMAPTSWTRILPAVLATSTMMEAMPALLRLLPQQLELRRTQPKLGAMHGLPALAFHGAWTTPLLL